MTPRSALFIFAGCLALVIDGQAPAVDPAGDWPQWRGPERTGVSRETGLLKEWPAGGPRLLWSVATLGPGTGTVAVAGERVFVQGSDSKQSNLMSLSRADGKTVWVTNLEVVLNAGSAGFGPRSTPTVDGDRVYVLTEAGTLACVKVEDGAVVWRRNIARDFEAHEPAYLFSESPLVDGGRVYVAPGGPKAGIVALDKMTGTTIWATEELGKTAAYGSMVVADIGGVRTLAAMTAGGGAGVRASDGKVMWKDARPATVEANIATPILFDDKVLYAHDSGLSLLKLTAGDGAVTATPIYFSTDITVQWGGVLLIDGFLYAFNPTGLYCLDAATGKRVWRDRSVGKGALTYADGHLYLLSDSFTVGLVEATPTEYREKGRFKIAESDVPSYAHPVVSGGRLYIRNQGSLSVYDIKAK